MPLASLCVLSLAFTRALGNEQHVLASEPWRALYEQVDGRLYAGVPFAMPCFLNTSTGIGGLNSEECEVVQAHYLNESFRASTFGAHINTQWETCQLTGEQCLLDYTNPSNPTASLPPYECHLGSVSSKYIDVRKPREVKAAFRFSRETGIPLVIKNTGHDYKGRSSAPGSLALWTHNLKSISYSSEFKPDGCSKTYPAVTMGAGVQWVEAYRFAEEHNITLVGGSDQSVGASGGWLMGGGHSALSNTMGLGVDRALQFRVVTPDGKHRTANACQNKDLFFALRGGGGGTFGVVLESTVLASPTVTLQTVIVAFSPNETLSKELFKILVDNGIKWADDGFGGFATTETAILLTPKLSKAEAAVSMAPLIEFGKRIKREGAKGALVAALEYPTWGAFFKAFTESHVALVGSSLALASRLVPRANFATPASRSDLVSGLLSANRMAPGLIILFSPPSSFPDDGMTSISDAWRSSIYHVTVISPWNYNTTAEEKREHYRLASNAIDNLRNITPDASYLNEADVYEPNHEVAFWGKHYPRLLKIKKKYDPHHLLDCWHCVGWNPKSSRFACYV